jgi:hypothetical protein
MHAESEARVAATTEVRMSSAGLVTQELPALDKMKDVETQDPPLSAFSVAASSDVLHLIGQYEGPSSSTQAQDYNKEMDSPPWHLD